MFDKSPEEDKEKEREGGGGGEEKEEEGGEKETNASISLIWPSQRLHLNFHLYIHVCFFYSSGFKSCKLKARHHLVQLRWPKENLWSGVNRWTCRRTVNGCQQLPLSLSPSAFRGMQQLVVGFKSNGWSRGGIRREPAGQHEMCIAGYTLTY